jgi:hypothetical protein
MSSLHSFCASPIDRIFDGAAGKLKIKRSIEVEPRGISRIMKLLKLSGLAVLIIGGVMLQWADAKAAKARFSPLQGLPGVLVKIDVDKTLVNDGLALNLIRTDIEIKLEEAGIKVLTDKEWYSSEGHPQLKVRVNGTKAMDNWKFYSFAVHLHLLQDVYMIRDEQTSRFQAATWYSTVADHGYIPDIRTRIRELIEAFAGAFNGANQP